MPESPEQTVMDTPMGEVDISDFNPTPDDMSETHQSDDTEAAPASEAQPAPAVPMIKVGDAEYTPEQLQELVADIENARTYRREGQTGYEEAKRLRAEAEEILNDSELTTLRQVKTLMAEHPELQTEWQQMKAWLSGSVPVPANIAQNMTAPLLHEVQALREQVGGMRESQNLDSAKTAIDELLAEHNAIPGVTEWTRDSDEFKAFFEEFDTNHPKEGPTAADIRSYFWSHHGPRIVNEIATRSKSEGHQEAITKITKGKAAAATSVSPTPHKDVPYEPDITKPGFDDEINAAIADDSLFAGIPR